MKKLAADYAEIKARQGDYASVRAEPDSIENPDESEACCDCTGFNQSRDSLRAYAKTHRMAKYSNPPIFVRDKLATEMVYNPRIHQHR